MAKKYIVTLNQAEQEMLTSLVTSGTPVCVNGLRQQDAEFTVDSLSVSPPIGVGNSESCGKVDRRALPTFPQLLRLRRGRLIRS